jgi:hypothetical protein
MRPTSFVACRACGHEESVGAFIRYGSGEHADPALVAERAEAARKERLWRQREDLKLVDFPNLRRRRPAAKVRLGSWLHADGAELPGERSDAGLIIAWRARDRARRKLVARAARSQYPIRIDGELEPFTLLQAGERWVVVRRRAKQTITVSAKDVDPGTISLRPLEDPDAPLFGEAHRALAGLRLSTSGGWMRSCRS